MTPTDPQCHASLPQLAARLSVRVVELIQGDGLRYTCSIHFLTPRDYDKFFKFLRDRNYNFTSELDAVLERNGV
jgi:hypothetical protein